MDNQEETANLVTGEAVSSLETKLHSNSRQGFIAKVYSIICFQLLLTAAAVIVTLQSPVIKAFLWKQWWLIIIAFVVQIVTMLMILCCQGISRNVPTNYIVLTIFTLAECYVVAAICSRVSPAIVLYCAILTTVMVIGLTIYAFVTEIDYTKLLPYLFMACLLLLTASIVNIFLRLPALRMIIAAVGVFLFSVYLIVDTQLVIGKNSQLLELDDYILGALLIYLDIIQIFLQLLQLMGSRN